MLVRVERLEGQTSSGCQASQRETSRFSGLGLELLGPVIIASDALLVRKDAVEPTLVLDAVKNVTVQLDARGPRIAAHMQRVALWLAGNVWATAPLATPTPAEPLQEVCQM